MGNEPVMAADAIAWEETLGAMRPAAMTRPEAERAIEISSFSAQNAGNGICLRLAGPSGGAIDLFLNAALAVQMINALCEIGNKGVWRNEDDGSLIVRDPQNLRYVGRKS